MTATRLLRGLHASQEGAGVCVGEEGGHAERPHLLSSSHKHAGHCLGQSPPHTPGILVRGERSPHPSAVSSAPQSKPGPGDSPGTLSADWHPAFPLWVPSDFKHLTLPALLGCEPQGSISTRSGGVSPSFHGHCWLRVGPCQSSPADSRAQDTAALTLGDPRAWSGRQSRLPEVAGGTGIGQVWALPYLLQEYLLSSGQAQWAPPWLPDTGHMGTPRLLMRVEAGRQKSA